MKIIPFALTPAGIGLKGKDREKAQAYYELTGVELHRKLCEIDFEKDSPEYRKRMKEIDIEFDAFETEEARDYAKHEVKFLDEENSDKALLAKAELDKKYEKITPLEYEKEVATINNEPWVGYKEYDLEEGEDGRLGFWFDLDWNTHFINKLREEGYEGNEDDEVVRRWYAELCRTIALEEGLAMDLFDNDGGEVEAMHVPKTAIKKRNLDDEHTEYS